MNKLFLSAAILVTTFGLNFQLINATDISLEQCGLSQRPHFVQTHIDEAFEKINQQDPKRWYSNGKENYQMLSTNQDNETIDSYISSRIDAGQTDINIMDIGAGNGAWGRALANRINQYTSVPDNICINIFSLTGEKYDAPAMIESGKCSIHNLHSFKIEDLNKELKKKNLDLNNKVDLMISHLTFIHLYDPLGTLQKAINLMRPHTGLMINQWSPLNLLKDEKNTSLGQRKINEDLSLSYFYNTAVNSKLEMFVSSVHKSFKNYVLKKKTTEKIRFPFEYYSRDQQSNIHQSRCHYVVKENSWENLVRYHQSSGSQDIYNEIRKYNPKFNEIYDESPPFIDLFNQ